MLISISRKITFTSSVVRVIPVFFLFSGFNIERFNEILSEKF